MQMISGSAKSLEEVDSGHR